MSLDALEQFYSTIHEAMDRVLIDEGLPDTVPAYWVVLGENTGVTCERLFEGPVEPTAVLRRLIEDNPELPAVALVSYVEPEGASCLLGYARVRDPDNSDLRRAEIIHRSDGLQLGPWAATIG